MVQILHLIGPQGVGKSTLGEAIVKGMRGKAAVLLGWEDVAGRTNDQLRAAYADSADLLCIEAERVESRHSDLQPADWVVTVARGDCHAA